MRKGILIWLVVASMISCGGQKSATNVEVTETVADTSIIATDDEGKSEIISESDFDGDPAVSGSSANIISITKSIADGDAKISPAVSCAINYQTSFSSSIGSSPLGRSRES